MLPFGIVTVWLSIVRVIIARYPLKGTGERLRSQQREAERHPAKTGAPFRAQVSGVEGLFQSLLAQSFTEGLSESF